MVGAAVIGHGAGVCVALTGLGVFWFDNQGSAALHPGLKLCRRFAARLGTSIGGGLRDTA